MTKKGCSGMNKELEALMKYAPIIPNENDFTYWSEYRIALQKYERQLQTFTKTFELLKQALEELEAIKSIDSGDALKELEMIRDYYDEDDEDDEDEVTYDSWKIVENYILKAQAQEKELAELKKKVVKYVNLSKYAVSGDLEDNEFLEFWELGEKLCKGSKKDE